VLNVILFSLLQKVIPIYIYVEMVDTRTKVGATHPYYSWTPISDQIFLDIMGELLTKGNGRQSDGKIFSAIINTAMDQYNAKTGANITRINYDSR
jgi:hypothetical protein